MTVLLLMYAPIMFIWLAILPTFFAKMPDIYNRFAFNALVYSLSFSIITLPPTLIGLKVVFPKDPRVRLPISEIESHLSIHGMSSPIIIGWLTGVFIYGCLIIYFRTQKLKKKRRLGL